MCFSQFAQFEPRPTFEEAVPAVTRPEGAPPTQAERDPNLYGPIPMPPEWRVELPQIMARIMYMSIAKTMVISMPPTP